MVSSNGSPQVHSIHEQGLTAISGGRNPCVDIILVHAPGGHPESTWVSGSAFWPLDLLSVAVPETRILTYGYTAETTANEDQILQYSMDLFGAIENERTTSKISFDRPIIFICQNDGTLVAREALVFSNRMNDERKFLAKSTHGIIFIEEAQNDINYSLWTKISNLFSHDSTANELGALEALRDQILAPTLMRQKYGISVISFRHLILPSGQILHSIERAPPLQGSEEWAHAVASGDCKFLDDKDERFLEIVTHIKNLLGKENPSKATAKPETAEEQIRRTEIHANQRPQSLILARPENLTFSNSSRRESLSTYYIVHGQASPIFKGRSDVLNEIKDYFLPKQPSFQIPVAQRRFLLYGPGGSGKTEIAKRFAECYRQEFWGIFWIDGTNKETTEASFRSIAQQAGLKLSSESVKNWLASQEKEWLLIIDNADEQIDTVLGFFPAGRRGNVLVTSRIPEARMPRRCEIGGLGIEEAESLLLAAAGSKGVLPESPQEARELRRKAGAVVRTLGYIPLAIRLAGACIEKSCEVGDYLAIYRIRKGVPGSSKYYQSTTYTAAEVSIGYVFANNPGAVNLLKLFAFFGPSQNESTLRQARQDLRTHIFSNIGDITPKPAPSVQKPRKVRAIYKKMTGWLKRPEIEVLEENAEIIPEATIENMPSKLKQVLKDYHDDCWDQAQFRAAMETLVNFKLVEPDYMEKRYSLHSLVHSWIRDRTDEETQQFFQDFGNLSFLNSTVRRNTAEGASAEYVPDIDRSFQARVEEASGPDADQRSAVKKDRKIAISRGLSAQHGLILIKDRGRNHKMDIILLHGLDGNQRDTWTARGSAGQEIFWPQDLLPGAFPDARVFSYGYGAKTFDMKNLLCGGAASSDTILEHARELLTTLDDARQRELQRNRGGNRPVVFICHSLGGLVVKQALSQSRSATPKPTDTRHQLVTSTTGIIFMGTPHRGSRFACWAAVVGSLLQTVKLQPNASLLKSLRPGGDILKQQEEDFPPILTNYKIHIESFYESLPVPWIGTIVPRQSACLMVGERTHSINADHLRMCRFASADNKDFIAVIAALHRIAIHGISRGESVNSGSGLRGGPYQVPDAEGRRPSSRKAIEQTPEQLDESRGWFQGNRAHEMKDRGRDSRIYSCSPSSRPVSGCYGHLDWTRKEGSGSWIKKES